jgi:hypothetical protein
MVTRIDRLAHSICDLLEIILAIKAKGGAESSGTAHRYEHFRQRGVPGHAWPLCGL